MPLPNIWQKIANNDGIICRDMNTVNAHLIFKVNYTKLYRTSFIKQKYRTQITSTAKPVI